MGYSYGRTSRGGQALACDHCGESEGRTRKRTCPHKVLTDSLRSSNGKRHSISYCYPPAYCPDCFKKAGGSKGVHGEKCREGAAKSTAEYDAIEAALDVGEKFVVSASRAPEGKTEVTFWGRGATGEVRVLVPSESYNPKAKPKLSDYPEAVAA